MKVQRKGKIHVLITYCYVRENKNSVCKKKSVHNHKARKWKKLTEVKVKIIVESSFPICW